jgi:hypothetical protein
MIRKKKYKGCKLNHPNVLLRVHELLFIYNSCIRGSLIQRAKVGPRFLLDDIGFGIWVLGF